MNQMFTLGVVTVLIIFQPELRKALEQLGRGKLFTRSSAEEQDTSQQINEVIKSVNYLARRKIGALIVFERNTGLNDYIESGIKMDSRLSSELLSNVFVPNTPLHDGAVIIRGVSHGRRLLFASIGESFYQQGVRYSPSRGYRGDRGVRRDLRRRIGRNGTSLACRSTGRSFATLKKNR